MLFNTRNSSDEAFDFLKEQFLREGCCLIPDDHQVLTIDQWKTLNHEATKLVYEKIQCELDKNAPSFQVSPIKISGTHPIVNKPIFDVVNWVKSGKLISDLIGSTHFVIDGCESHLCEAGEAIPHHWSKTNFKGNHYNIYFFLEDNYTGGQFIHYLPDHKERLYCPKPGDIFFSSCEHSNEWSPVLSGKRNQIIAFIKLY